MESDDVIYLSLLIFSIVFGYFFKQLKDIHFKRWISTCTGFIIVLLVSGKHSIHPVLCVLVNSFIILLGNKRLCHIYSFFFTFLYLLLFRTTAYFGIPYPPSHTNLIQMILTLKVVGLAFEIHDEYDLKRKNDGDKTQDNGLNIQFSDIIHYCFCYIGVLTGPYYSYRTFSDFCKQKFNLYAPCTTVTVHKLKYIPIYGVIYFLATYYFPIKYVDTEEFDTSRSFWYRLFYVTPVFVAFRMRIYIGLILSECACTMAGLGAYPTFVESKPGKGPTKNLEKLNNLKEEKSLENVSFDFKTVDNINIWFTEFDPSVRSSIRYWNMCIQYWMAFIVYKRFPWKVLRTAATFTVSALWHGIYAGYFLCLGVVPFYLPIEDIWEDLLRKNKTGNTKRAIDVLFWCVRTQAFSYMAMAFSLLTLERGLKYYASVYYVYHFTSIIALLLGITFKKINTRKLNHKNK